MNQDSSEDPNEEATAEKRRRDLEMMKKKGKQDRNWEKFEMGLWYETRPQG